MPAYDYRCRECDTHVEVRRGLAEPEAPVPCPSCGATTSRVWTAVAVGAGAPAPAPAGGGGCCGGGCCG